MPTQEEINAARVELDIANDNYAATQARLDRYQRIFESYANANPETQARAASLMQTALNDYNNLRTQQYANEDRIAVAQNAFNAINAQIAQQPAAIATTWGQRRRTVGQPERIQQPVVETPTIYKVPQFTREQINPNLSYGATPQQPAYTPLPEYVPQYKNNTLWGIAKNFAWQSSRDWAQAWNEWRNITWPRMKNTASNILNTYENAFVRTPSRAADAVTNFILWRPQPRQ